MDSIRLDSVSKTYRQGPALVGWFGREQRGETRALDNISLRVPQGTALALLGPNGSGKTTLLKLIATILLPDRGTVLVEGYDTRVAGSAVRERVGFAIASERSFFPRLTARENLHFFAALDNIPRKVRRGRIRLQLEQTGLAKYADMLVMKFSSGMWQRLSIARALVKEPSLLLLDEPTRSLDPASTEEFWELVRGLRPSGTTLVLATHSFEEAAALADSAVVLQNGRLIAERRVVSTGVHSLRSWYFDLTQREAGVDEALPVAVGEWR
ncbi:MAG TPA: ABC transporter ATP-binding protein [Terriglobales bacterium]